MNGDEFLRAFHARHPGVTARAMARGVVDDGEGRSSYARLADEARAGERVLDLGCGDGWLLALLRGRGHAAGTLVGVDMSPEELAAARARDALAGVDLRCERAQALSLADASVDVALSHMAFMLMSDLERVVGELARVVRPGGRFATVVGGGPAPGAGDGFELFLDLFREVIERVAPEGRAPRLGDRRARDLAGMRELFHGGTGWSDVAETTHGLRLDGAPAEVWETLASMYEMDAVPAEEAAALGARFVDAAAARAGTGGEVPCLMRVRCLSAFRA